MAAAHWFGCVDFVRFQLANGRQLKSGKIQTRVTKSNQWKPYQSPSPHSIRNEFSPIVSRPWNTYMVHISNNVNAHALPTQCSYYYDEVLLIENEGVEVWPHWRPRQPLCVLVHESRVCHCNPDANANLRQILANTSFGNDLIDIDVVWSLVPSSLAPLSSLSRRRSTLSRVALNYLVYYVWQQQPGRNYYIARPIKVATGGPTHDIMKILCVGYNGMAGEKWFFCEEWHDGINTVFRICMVHGTCGTLMVRLNRWHVFVLSAASPHYQHENWKYA